jgi:uncharacterized protein
MGANKPAITIRSYRMKNAFLASVALAASALPAAALAQTGPIPAISPQSTLLQVSAEGTATRKPDVAVFTAGVSSTGKTASEALSANSADMTKVIAALKRSGIAERDIQTSNLSLNPVYADNSRQPSPMAQQMPRIIGYQASNMVTVKQRNLDEFGKVIDTLVAAGANQVNGPSFSIDEPESALDEARTAAVKKARQRAELYAGATGLKVGRLLSIDEAGGFSPRPMPMARMVSMDAAQAAPPVAAGEVGLTANVTVMFELTP